MSYARPNPTANLEPHGTRASRPADGCPFASRQAQFVSTSCLDQGGVRSPSYAHMSPAILHALGVSVLPSGWHSSVRDISRLPSTSHRRPRYLIRYGLYIAPNKCIFPYSTLHDLRMGLHVVWSLSTLSVFVQFSLIHGALSRLRSRNDRYFGAYKYLAENRRILQRLVGTQKAPNLRRPS